MKRIVNVARLQTINTRSIVWVPLVVLVAAFLVGLIIAAAARGIPIYSGGVQAPLWYFLALGIMTLARTFPFSQALGVTRRDFIAGTFMAALALGAVLASVVVIGGWAEQATNGWGVNLYFFHLPWLWSDGTFGAWLLSLACAWTLFIAGFLLAGVYQRWGTLQLTLWLAGLGLALALAVLVIARMNAWAALGQWFADTGALGFALLLAALGVVLGTASYGVVRRLQA